MPDKPSTFEQKLDEIISGAINAGIRIGSSPDHEIALALVLVSIPFKEATKQLIAKEVIGKNKPRFTDTYLKINDDFISRNTINMAIDIENGVYENQRKVIGLNEKCTCDCHKHAPQDDHCSLC